MDYYAQLGVEFRICSNTARIYDYDIKDFQDFVQVIPSGLAELVHWQNQGYVLITPRIQDKLFTVAEIR